MSAPIPLAPEVSGRWANVRYEESTKGCFWFIVKGVILTLVLGRTECFHLVPARER